MVHSVLETPANPEQGTDHMGVLNTQDHFKLRSGSFETKIGLLHLLVKKIIIIGLLLKFRFGVERRHRGPLVLTQNHYECAHCAALGYERQKTKAPST